MNKLDKERFRDIHIRHKYNILHKVLNVGTPQLSGLYLKSFYNAVKRNRLVLPNSIIEGDRKFCGSCGVIYVSGYTLASKVQNIESADSIERILVYDCLQCGHKKEFPLSIEVKTSKEVEMVEFSNFRSKETTSNLVSVNKKSTGRHRAKKRKKNSLINVLAVKKQQTDSKNKITLSLSDFLQK
ncbi:Snm1p Ecym_5586 [Eremothecium cymbalariae DBVPG|uniref:Uncharacterized protein n=1 Tax=Eremothecium cymbalariae (strain CBS 270.75 / DBVPG 7215 / KCTC 17166 / NRRL Y-17582) TaxID=931890 RepID=I6NE32_ERECY|nr:hypothetical protein Ecym_5586 [Eremothecium cymbalariae DBVPG\